MFSVTEMMDSQIWRLLAFPDIVNLNINKNLLATYYRSGTVNSKSFIGKVLLQIKWKFELTYAL